MADTPLAARVAEFDPGTPDWAVADALNAPDPALPAKTVDAAVSDARAILMTSGAWGGICLTAESADVPVQLRALCVTVRDAHLTLSTMHMTDPATAAAVNGMVGGLKQAGLVNQATYDALLALGSAPASWADIHNNAQPVTPRDVGIARGAKA